MSKNRSNMRVIAAEMVGGRRIVDVPFTDGTFEDTLNGIGSLSITVPLYSKEAQDLELAVTAAPSRSFLGLSVDESQNFQQLGPVWKHSYSKNRKMLKITAANTWSYFNFRALLGIESETMSLLAADGSSNPATDFNVSGLDLGTIAKRAVQRTNDRPGQQLPMLYQADRAGDAVRNLKGADLKNTGDFLTDITNLEFGPDLRFDGQWTDDRLGVQVLLRTGTTAEPRLFQVGDPHRWDFSVPSGAIRNLEVEIDGQNMADVAYTTGGRTDDVVLMDRQFNGLLRSQKYPRLDYIDTSHSSVSRPDTLAAYGRETLRKGSVPTSFWSFEVRTDARPFLGEYRVGDYCNIVIKGDPYVPDGTYLRRIVQISGNLKGKWVKVTTGATEWNIG